VWHALVVTVKLALAGDTMLGRMVAERLASAPPHSLFSPGVVEAIRETDLFILNLECCISDRGERWPSPGKPFFFRAPRIAVDALALLGVRCVTLANNHALDFGEVALADTLEALGSAGIAAVGAGPDVAASRRPAVLEASGQRVAVVGVTDHPSDFAAGRNRPGVAYADLRAGVPEWLAATIAEAARGTDIVVVSPHWGPNMVALPVPHVRSAASIMVEAGATIVAGHSAHVFHGVDGKVLFDLGDFIDDYAVDPQLRNDLGLLWLVTLDGTGPRQIEAVPLRLDYCHTRLADGDDAAWIRRRFQEACAAFGTDVIEHDNRLAVAWA
jgi:poly-gamma-glutamate capsule biosynthesis protein CapA/YwtB (metallophosphatase superfamily)